MSEQFRLEEAGAELSHFLRWWRSVRIETPHLAPLRHRAINDPNDTGREYRAALDDLARVALGEGALR